MTDLSDFKRHIHEPLQRRLAECAERAAMWEHRATKAELIVERQAEAMRGARTALGNAVTERTHGLTASAAFIDRCIDSAITALDIEEANGD